MKKHEKYAQEIPLTYSDKYVCLVCDKFHCNCDVRLKIFLDYINGWADEGCYEFTNEQKLAYRQCVEDIYLTSKKIFMRQITKEV